MGSRYVKHVGEHNRFVDSKDVIFQLKSGLFGEIGSVLRVCKKLARDQKYYPKHELSYLIENIGDAFGTLLPMDSVSNFGMEGLRMPL